MKNNKINEPILAAISLIALGIIIATQSVAMSDATGYMLISFFALGIIGYGVYIWQERPADEREQALLMVASKHAYLAGSFILGLGIVAQSLEHNLDMWLPLALGATVLTKLVSFFIHRREQE